MHNGQCCPYVACCAVSRRAVSRWVEVFPPGQYISACHIVAPCHVRPVVPRSVSRHCPNYVCATFFFCFFPAFCFVSHSLTAVKHFPPVSAGAKHMVTTFRCLLKSVMVGVHILGNLYCRRTTGFAALWGLGGLGAAAAAHQMERSSWNALNFSRDVSLWMCVEGGHEAKKQVW